MISTVLFDLDDTVFDFTRAEREAISATLAAMEIPYTDATLTLYHNVNAECWRMLERGEITRERLLTYRFELLFSRIGVNADPERALEIYEPTLGSIHRLIPGASEMLTALRGKYTLIAVSNGIEKIQMERLRKTDLLPLFDGVYISESVGHNKPSPRFFDYVFSCHPCPRNEAIIVGDSPTSDILGGKNAGIRTCYFNRSRSAPPHGIIPDYEIDSPDKLPELLYKINLDEEK